VIGLASWILVWALAAQTPSRAAGAVVAVPKPGPKDLCSVCGMIVAKYPNWTATVVWKDGRVHHFDGAKDLFTYLLRLSKYAPTRSARDLAAVAVTEFYDLRPVDARQAFYVVGSDVLGPMGHELVPLATRADADEFIKDHHGRRVLRFADVTLQVVQEVDAGRDAPWR
jgi:nitrous oxide reductase accessory protein NosL